MHVSWKVHSKATTDQLLHSKISYTKPLSPETDAHDKEIKLQAARKPALQFKTKLKQGFSAGASKRFSSKKLGVDVDSSSIYIPESVNIRIVSGGLPSLGKRKS